MNKGRAWRPSTFTRCFTKIFILSSALAAIFCMGCGGDSAEDYCGPADSATGLQECTYAAPDGQERTWLLRLPAGYNEETLSDVVFNFHGSGGSAITQHAYANFTTLADRDNVILVTPNAAKIYSDPDHPLADYWEGAWEAVLRETETDMDFIAELVALLQTDFNTGEFFATGMSAGGDMSSALVCDPDTPFIAFGPVAYLYYNQAECVGAPARPYIYFHGTDDFVCPIDGSGPPWNDPPVADVMGSWAAHNGCDPVPLEETISDEVVRYVWQNCDASTEWYKVIGGGHTWPGAADVPYLGYTTHDISASDLIWELFFGSSP